MKTMQGILLSCLLLAVAASAQNGPPQIPLVPPHALTVKVVLFGHSWIARMQGFQPWAFPNIPRAHIVVGGYPGYTCQELLPLLAAWVPASTNAAFIMAATNDVIDGVPVATHIACMETMINQMITENPHMLIVLSNVPPLGKSFGKDLRSVIAAYNQAYAGLPQLYPNNVVLVDMWTPLVDTGGWALANILTDGVHPGTNGWDEVMGIIRDGLYSGLPQ